MSKLHLGISLSLCFASILTLATVPVCHAELVEYTIDSSQSSLTMAGSYSGFDFAEQVSGSLVTSYSGMLSADLAGGVLTFSGGNTIEADANPNGPFIPTKIAIGDIDNYGVAVPSPVGDLADAAIRDLQLDFLAGTVANGVVPSTLSISLPQYVFAYEVYDTFFTDPETGESLESDVGVLNTTAAAASLTDDGVTETLIIPILRFSDDGEIALILEGEIVATRPVPEPATWVLMGFGLIGLAALSRRKRRR